MRLLILDNYDSFTYNIANAFRELGLPPDVRRNDTLTVSDADAYDAIVISPGPGIPSEAGILPRLLKCLTQSKPILGICLGHQAIGECFGATLRNLDKVYHGISSTIDIITDDYMFEGLPASIDVGRYHSWVIDRNSLPGSLEVTATSRDGEIMAIRHKIHDIRGLQFHPESLLTPCGSTILSNWLNHLNIYK